MKLDKQKWQTDFERQLDIAEKPQLSKVRRFYKSEYNKGINSFIAEGQTNFELLFAESDFLKIYRDLYTDIGLRFAKWYARNFDKYLTKGVNPNEFVDQWQNSFASLGSAVGAQRVTLVSGTAKKTLIDLTQKLLRDPEFMVLGTIEKGRILRNQFNKYSAYQSRRLVQTEATNAANFATMESATTIFPGAQMMKEWIASFDDRTRSTHAEAGASEPVPYNDAFMVGGSLLMYPGDPSGPAAEVVNCRCSVAPFPKQGAQTVGELSGFNFGLAGAESTGFNNIIDVALLRNSIIAEYEDTIKNQNFESAGLYDKNGNLLFNKNGAAQSVKFTDDELNRFKGNYLTHNHPLDQSFSPEDIQVLSYWGLSEIRAVTKTRTFVMKSNKQFTNKREYSQLKSDITRISNKVQKRLEKMYNSGQITLDEYYYTGMDEIWKEFSKSKKYKDIFTYESF